MKQWMMICFCLTSLLCLNSTPIFSQNTARPFFDLKEKVLLKSSIDIFNQHFSGLLIIKEIEDKKYRLVFTTELGVKVFDYEILNGIAQQQYIMPALKKKSIDKILKRDLAVLIAEFEPNSNRRRSQKNELGKLSFKNQYGRSTYFYNNSDRANKAIHRGRLGKKKLVLNASYTDNKDLEVIKFYRPGLIKLSGQYRIIEQ